MPSPRRVLSMLGEGVSSQVVLAADTFRPDAPPIAVKILKRQHSYAGQKVRKTSNSHPRVWTRCAMPALWSGARCPRMQRTVGAFCAARSTVTILVSS